MSADKQHRQWRVSPKNKDFQESTLSYNFIYIGQMYDLFLTILYKKWLFVVQML